MGTVCRRIFPGNEVRRAGPGISPVWHYHSEVELDLVIAGQGTYFLDNTQHELSPGAMIWLLPDQSHRLLPGPDLMMWVVTFSKDRLEEAFLSEVAARTHRVLARDDAVTLDRLFAHVSQDADEPQLYRAGIAYALKSALHLSTSGPDAAQAPLHPAVLSALRILRGTSDLSAASLAARCGVSQVYLRQLLIEQTGRGLVEWRNRFRLERFQLLYPESEDLLTAALEAGFGSYIQFHRVFQSVVGTTPGEWIAGDRELKSPPPIADFMPASNLSNGRMIWYSLADVVFKELREAIAPGFADMLIAGAETGGADGPVPSHVISSYDQHRFTDELLRDVDTRDAECGRRLRNGFSRVDLYAANANQLSLWGYDLTDIAPIIAIHIMTAWRLIYRYPIPTHEKVQAFVGRVAAALQASGSFDRATITERQCATAALCVQSFVLRSAVMGAHNVGTDTILDAVASTARRTILETYGLDIGAEL